MDKKKYVLIVEVDEPLRKGLRTIFAEEPDGAEVYEVTSSEDLQVQLESHCWDLIVINQALIPDITLLPRGRFIVVTIEPDPEMLFAARMHGARSYLLRNNVSGELLRKILRLPNGSFLTDPAMSAWIEKYLMRHTLFSISHEVLSDREREVFHLLWQGKSKRKIAEQLHLSPATIRTHLEHIYEKLHLNRNRLKILSLLTKSDEQA